MTDFDYIMDTPWVKLEKELLSSGSFSRSRFSHDSRLQRVDINIHPEVATIFVELQFFEAEVILCISTLYKIPYFEECGSIPIYKSNPGGFTYRTRNYQEGEFYKLREIYDSLVEIRMDLLPSLWIVSEYFNKAEGGWRKAYKRITGKGRIRNDLFKELVDHFHGVDNTPESFEELVRSYENRS